MNNIFSPIYNERNNMNKKNVRIKHISLASAPKTFRKGQAVTDWDVKFANTVRRMAYQNGYTLASLSRTMGRTDEYAKRIVNLRERPSRESAAMMMLLTGFSENQVRAFSGYLRSLRG